MLIRVFFKKFFNDIHFFVYFLAKVITHFLFKHVKVYTTLYVWLCIKCVVYIKSFLQQQGLANPISRTDQGEGAYWFCDYFTRAQNLVAILAKSRFHMTFQDYNTNFIGCNDNICIGLYFIFVLHKIIFKRFEYLTHTAEVFWTTNLMKYRQKLIH